jgi:hypothetical protein
MGKSKGSGENSKKAAGNARKEAAASAKQAEQARKNAAVEDAKWQQGAKGSSKAYEATPNNHNVADFLDTAGTKELPKPRRQRRRRQSEKRCSPPKKQISLPRAKAASRPRRRTRPRRVALTMPSPRSLVGAVRKSCLAYRLLVSTMLSTPYR